MLYTCLQLAALIEYTVELEHVFKTISACFQQVGPIHQLSLYLFMTSFYIRAFQKLNKPEGPNNPLWPKAQMIL